MNLSIILVNYNYARYLPQAIESILRQDLSNVEVIIYDDNSTDDSCQIIESFLKRHPHFRFFKSKQNRGVIGAMNETLKHATGTYLHYLASDDFYSPHFVQTHMYYLHQHSWAGMSTSDLFYFFDENVHRPTTFQYVPQVSTAHAFPPEHMAKIFRATYLQVGGRHSVVKTALVREYGGFKQELRAACDWYAYTKIALLHGIIYIPEPLIYERKLQDSYSFACYTNFKAKKEMHLSVLDQVKNCENRSFRKSLKRSSTLAQVLKTLAVRNIFFPLTWSYYFIPLWKTIRRRWKERCNAPFVTETFLKKYSK